MTLVIGVRCGDGIVIGADSVATYATPAGEYTVEQRMDSKVHKVDDKLLYAFSGSASLGQDVMQSLSRAWERNKNESKAHIRRSFSRAATEPIKDYADRIRHVRLLLPEATLQDIGISSIVAFAAGDEHALIQYSLEGHPEEFNEGLPFVTIGSGQPYADPFVAFVKRVAWQDRQPRTVKQGIVGVLWALQYVSDSSSSIGVGGPFTIGVLEKREGEWQAGVLQGERLDLYRGAIESAERSLYAELNNLEVKADSPAPPRLTS